VLPDRIELSTSPLPRECSTTELRQRTGERHGVQRDGEGHATVLARSQAARRSYSVVLRCCRTVCRTTELYPA
jgi:hypothetical protein